MSHAERKQLLLVACACDRMEWEIFWRQRSAEFEQALPPTPGRDPRLLSLLGTWLPFMPGWVRTGVKVWQWAAAWRRQGG